MSSGATRIFDIANSGLNASRSSLGSASHNVANANTKGYSRQKVDQVTGPSIPKANGYVGSGVRNTGVSRTSDEYLSQRIGKEATSLGYAEERKIFLSQSEQVFNESNVEGFNHQLSKFFNEFKNLSLDPSNIALRSTVRASAKSLVKSAGNIDNGLLGIQKNIDARIKGYTKEFNSILHEVREFNALISAGRVGGKEVPDLDDRRDLAINRLGELSEISVFENDAGMMSITVAGQGIVLSGDTLNELELRRTPGNSNGKPENTYSIYLHDVAPFELTPYMTQGRIGALLGVRDGEVGRAMEKMDTIAFSLVNNVNTIHQAGYGLDGVGERDFFQKIEEESKGRAIELFRLSDEVTSSLDAIAAGLLPEAPGDNRIALQISKLPSLKGSSGIPDHSVVEDYNSIVADIGSSTAFANKELTFKVDVMNQLEGFREQISGVSLDEETADIVRFQHAYSANAKVMKVADEMLETIIGLLG